MPTKFENVEDLLTDQSFQSWYFKTNVTEADLWEKEMSNDPSLKNLTAEAVTFLNRISIKENIPAEPAVRAAEARMMENLNNINQNGKVRHMARRRLLWIAAAAIMLLVSVVAITSYFGSSESNFRTAYGEIKQFGLPDGSVITMNANSTLLYQSRWAGDREVWIEGEAFFHVKSAAGKKRFIVHTGAFDVVVTGTSFNVYNRNARRNVFLEEGSVVVSREDAVQEHMKPGDYVEYAGNGKLQKQTQSASNRTAWLDKRFVFEKTPLRDVATAVTDIYGIKVIIEDSLTSNQLITGILPNDNLDIFLQSLEATGNFRMERIDRQITIRSSK